MNDQQQAELLRALRYGKTAAEFLKWEGLDISCLGDVTWDAGVIAALLSSVTGQGAGFTARGIDTSTFQGAPDLQRVQAGGVEFVIARAGYGAGNTDRQFHRTAGECNRLGLPVGAYWFSYALNEEDAVREARACLETVRAYRLEYPVFYDFEYDSVRYAEKKGVKVTRDLATRIVTAFCREIEAAGYYAAFYTNGDLARNLLDMGALSRFDVWYARYQPELDREGVGMWQYSSTGRVDGIDGDVDLDLSLRDYPAMIRREGLNGLTAFEPAAGWAEESWKKAFEKGIMDGRRPGEAVTRQELAVVLDRCGIL